MGSDHQQSEPNIYVVNSSSMSMDQPLSSVTTTTSVLPDVTGKKCYNYEKKSFLKCLNIKALFNYFEIPAACSILLQKIVLNFHCLNELF
jgi:hypothetical protein